MNITKLPFYLGLLLLLSSCDEPATTTKKVEQHSEGKAATPLEEVRPTEIVKQYFEAIKKRDHKALQQLLRYPAHRFYLKEPSPITHWQIEGIEELSAAEADSILIKPNPIQEDLLITVKEFTVDEYKKTAVLAQYILREEKYHWYLINRIPPTTVASIFLKIGEHLDFEEYEIKQTAKNKYLVEVEPWLWLTVDEKTKVIDTLEVDKDERLRMKNGNEIWTSNQQKASWQEGSLQIITPAEDSTTQKLPERDTLD